MEIGGGLVADEPGAIGELDHRMQYAKPLMPECAERMVATPPLKSTSLFLSRRVITKSRCTAATWHTLIVVIGLVGDADPGLGRPIRALPDWELAAFPSVMGCSGSSALFTLGTLE